MNKGKLVIRQFHSPSNDFDGEIYVGIDSFSDLERRVERDDHYSVVMTGYNDHFKPGIDKTTITSSFGICEDDEIIIPTMDSYIIFGEALKRKGFKFNKKKGELIYVKK